jgi:large subunit ribosomal protein L14e
LKKGKKYEAERPLEEKSQTQNHDGQRYRNQRKKAVQTPVRGLWKRIARNAARKRKSKNWKNVQNPKAPLRTARGTVVPFLPKRSARRLHSSPVELQALERSGFEIETVCSTVDEPGESVSMALLEEGRVCMKTQGRGAGKKVVVLELKDGKALVEGIGVKRKAVSIRHLYPTPQKVSVSKSATHEHITELLKGTK